VRSRPNGDTTTAGFARMIERAAADRPETLRRHQRLAEYYQGIPEPKTKNKFAAFIKSFFLTA
jgi:hypothetical protein